MSSKLEKMLGVSVSLLTIATIYNSIAIADLKDKISKLDKRGEVTATLERIPVKQKVIPQLYNSHTKIVFNDNKEFDCHAKNIYYEARGEGYIGKIAVAQITFNRAETGKWGYSFCNVVHARKQFSWTNKKQNPPKGADWYMAKDAAKSFVRGVRVTPLQDGNHYHASYVKPYWSGSMQKVGTIGRHIFYAEK